MNSRKLTNKQLSEVRRYKGTIRIVGNFTIEKNAYIKNDGKQFWTMRTWYGRSTKANHYYSYRTEAQRDSAIEQIISSERLAIAARAENEKKHADAKGKFVNPYMVGHVFSNSWGYDQTNVDYYEVVATTDWTVTIREISQNASETGFMCGKCQPVRGKFIGGTKVKRIQLDQSGKPYVPCKYGWMSDWDGKADAWSNYA